MHDDERQLVARCRAGDEAAFSEFVSRFQSLVFGLCARMLNDRHEAEDVAQEVFVRALRALDRWDGERSLRPWLVTIAVNRCRTYLKRRKNRPMASDLAEEPVDPRPTNHGEMPELTEAIREAIAVMREDYRRVFLLFHEAGLGYEEMSEITGRPVGTLKTWLFRARGLLSSHLRARGLLPEVDRDDVS